MGNLHNASWSKVRSAALPVGAGVAALLALRWRMNVLALGDEETRAVGLSPEREKLLLLVPAVLAATGARSVTSFEVPAGIFTTLIGGPFFLWLLRRSAAGYFGD